MDYRFETSTSMKVQVLEEQLKEISSLEKIKWALTQDDVIGFDIFKDSALIGFAMLRKYDEYGWFLWDYAIDAKYQNKGHGQRILKELIAYMKEHYKATEISTTYIWGNEHAKHVYETIGFVETDVVDEEDCHEVNMVYKCED